MYHAGIHTWLHLANTIEQCGLCSYRVAVGGGQAPPVWSSNMDLSSRQVVQLSGKTVQLKCPADSHPKPTIRWLKNDRNFTDRPIGKVCVLSV